MKLKTRTIPSPWDWLPIGAVDGLRGGVISEGEVDPSAELSEDRTLSRNELLMKVTLRRRSIARP